MKTLYAEHLKEAEWLVSYTKRRSKAELNEALEKKKCEQREELQLYEKEHKERIRKQKSDRSKQLNDSRHKKDYTAKAKVIEEWEKDPSKFPSAEQAGRYFADWLEPQGFQYEPRTATRWIRYHAKQIGVEFR